LEHGVGNITTRDPSLGLDAELLNRISIHSFQL
jgi:hypothetical protein